MGWVAPVLMVASAGFQIVSSISGFQSQKRATDNALALQRSSMELARSTAELQAAQQSADRTRRYSDVISSQTALWAARGVQLNSGVVRAVADASTEAYNRDINTIEMNRMNRLASIALQGADYEAAAAASINSARSRMISGITSSLFSVGSAAVSGGWFSSSGGGGGIASMPIDRSPNALVSAGSLGGQMPQGMI